LGERLPPLSIDYPRNLFEIPDWEGKTVHMTVKTFQTHLAYRPMMAEYVDEAKITIRDPDHIQQAHHGAMRLCRLGLGRTIYSKSWLVVIVYYSSNFGTAATYQFMRQLPVNEQIIRRRALYIGGMRYTL
jgi:hypothetical protein